MYNTETDIASKTPKQDDEEEKHDHHAQPQQPVIAPEAQTQLDEVMNILSMKLHETVREFERRQTQLCNDFLAGRSKV